MTNFERHMELIACQAKLHGATDEIRSLVASVAATVKVQREKDVALATIARVEALATQWWDHPASEGQIDAAADIRAALAEPTK